LTRLNIPENCNVNFQKQPDYENHNSHNDDDGTGQLSTTEGIWYNNIFILSEVRNEKGMQNSLDWIQSSDITDKTGQHLSFKPATFHRCENTCSTSM
jgi:hypothetical protein